MSKENFSTVIVPKTGWFDIHLQELFRYRDLIWLFVRRNFVSQYKQTILGPIWAVVQPLLTTVVFTVIFGNIAGLAADGVPSFLFFANLPQYVKEPYKRFLENKIRAKWNFHGVPMNIFIRQK